MTETEQRRRIRGITVYDVAQRCLPRHSPVTLRNSSYTQQHSVCRSHSWSADRRVYFKHTTTAPSQLIPGLHLIFGRRQLHWLAQLSSVVDVQYFLSIFVIFLHIALKIWHKLFVLFRLSKIWKKVEFSILPIFENFFLFFAYFAINRKRGH